MKKKKSSNHTDQLPVAVGSPNVQRPLVGRGQRVRVAACNHRHDDAGQVGQLGRHGLVHVVAEAELPGAVVAPAVDLAAFHQRHGGRLPAGYGRDALAANARDDLLRAGRVGRRPGPDLAAGILAPSPHLDKMKSSKEIKKLRIALNVFFSLEF